MRGLYVGDYGGYVCTHTSVLNMGFSFLPLPPLSPTRLPLAGYLMADAFSISVSPGDASDGSVAVVLNDEQNIVHVSNDQGETWNHVLVPILNCFRGGTAGNLGNYAAIFSSQIFVTFA